MELIDKAALVAEIDDWRDKIKKGIFSIPLTGSDKAYATFEYEILGKVRDFLDTIEVKEVKEEPTSNDIEAEFVLYLKHKFNIPQEGNKLKTDGWRPSPYDILDIAKHFAQWQREQMEKNRIEHCDNITEEQYNLETGFIDEHLKKHNRIPTILDAIEYGMKKAQKG